MPLPDIGINASGELKAEGAGMRDCLFCCVVCLITCFHAAMSTAAADDVRSIAEVRRLPPAEVAKEPEVRVRGVVTHRDGNTVIIDDGTAGIFVNHLGARSRGLTPLPHLPDDVQPQRTVEVEGPLIIGGYAPVILPRTLVVTGTATLPPIRPTTAARLFSGADDCQLVECEGVVQGVRETADFAELSLDSAGGLFLARVDKAAFNGELASLVDAVVRLGGICLSRFNARGEYLMPSIRVGREGRIEVVSPPPYEPFGGPKIPLSHLAGFSAVPRDGHMVRIEGTVVHAAAGEVYVQNDAIGVRIETNMPVECVAGDRIEAAGFIDRRQRVAGLVHAVIRRLAKGSSPRPIAISPDEIVAINRFSMGTYTRSAPGDYENCLVTFPARLVEKQVTHVGGSLLMAAGKTTVIAQLSMADYKRLAGVAPGADLALTGLVRTVWEPTKSFPSASIEVLDRMTLLVRSADDVTVLRAPSWWTPRRLAILAGGLAAVAAGAMLWVVLLRRQAARLAKRIADEIRLRRDAAVEFEATLRERNRLAVNLHDTVLQTVTGIGYQVAACKDDEGRPSVDVDRHFGLVERMVTHAVRQLRGTVWALKAAAPSGRPFPAALGDLAARLGEERDAVIDVAVDPKTPVIDELVAGNLLLIAQESLLNALRHADASAIAVRVGPAAPLAVEGPPAVELTVRDDGHGFDPADRPGARQGHFGIEGMCERVERLGGSIAIESQPGRGTTVIVRVPAAVGTPDDRTGRDSVEAASIPV